MEILGKRRKVRFDVPESKHERERNGKIREHGTIAYVNGTLITSSQRASDIARNKTPIITATATTASIASNIVPTFNIHILPKVSKETEDVRNVMPSSAPPAPQSLRIATRGSSEIDYRNYDITQISNNNRFIQTAKVAPSERLPETIAEKIEKLRARHVVVITSPPKRSVYSKMEDNIINSDRFSRFRLLEDILARKRKSLKLIGETEIRKPPQRIQERIVVPQTITVDSISKNLFSPDHNTNVVTDLLQRWNRFRYREATKLQSVSNKIASRKDPLETVSFRDRIKADVRRWTSFK